MHFGAWALFFSPQKKGTATLTVPFIYAVANNVRPFLLSHGYNIMDYISFLIR